jgi:hypothetical protein
VALIVIRLHPVEPVLGAVFRGFLDGVTIEAFDLSTRNELEGTSIGTATYVAGDDPFTPDPDTDIVQHWGEGEFDPPLGDPEIERKAVATAVIAFTDPVSGEFSSRDLRLVVKRGTAELIHRRLYFNVPVEPGDPPDKDEYPRIATTSLYLPLPPVGFDVDSPGVVELPSDGTPPRFTDVVEAANLVLGADPGAGDPLALRDVTPRQARHIAREIVWNQAIRPLPGPIERTLDQLYTPPDSGEDDPEGGDEVMRAKFEGDLASYYATGEAEADRLAPYVYAAGAAQRAAQLSGEAGLAGLMVPVLPGSADRPATAIGQVRVVLDLTPDPNNAPATPPFAVPEVVFYALTATLPTSIAPEQRYELAIREEEVAVRATVQAAVDAGLIALPDGVTVPQMARRLQALGATTLPAPQYPLHGTDSRHADVRDLATAWLAFTAAEIDGFWSGLTAGQARGHLELVVRALTEDTEDGHALSDAITDGTASTAELAARPASYWEGLFDGDDADLLPEFTRPGSTAERVAAFVRHVRKFFLATLTVGLPEAPGHTDPLSFPLPGDDPVSRFAATFPTRLGTEWAGSEGTVRDEIETVLPDDEPAQEWLWQALSAINELVLLTAPGSGDPSPSWPEEGRLSVVEALYARGFVARSAIAALTVQAFTDALVGTVAHPHAAALHALAVHQVGAQETAEPGAQRFRPINPDGCLVDCVPPPHRSPLGPVAYLNELLRLTARSSCDEQFPDEGAEIPSSASVATLLTDRRGPIGDLAASRANLERPIPVVDLVNELLEALVADPNPTDPNPATWPVRDTADTALGGHALAPQDPAGHDPVTLFAALPEHSTPATPVLAPAAYDILRADFIAPELPYPQALDVNRTYLQQLGTSRYATMRRFRRDIHEPALSPVAPAGFPAHLWRYPVRIELAVEYLGLSPEEHARLFDGEVTDVPELYGFTGEALGWLDVVVRLPEFLRRTRLSYCEFLELERSEFVRFRPAGGGGEIAPQEFPRCEPCDLDRLQIEFLDPADPADALARLAVFVRLWRTLRSRPDAGYDFATLRGICVVFGLFRAGRSVDPDFLRRLAAFQILRDDLGLALVDPANPPGPGATGADRTHLLALWAAPAAATTRDWAVDELVDQIGALAQHRHGCPPRDRTFRKLLVENLDALSLLAGFDPAPGSPDRWDAQPQHTLRFAEALVKIYASGFGIGEVHALFTADPHLRGDDPFALPPDNEAADDPLSLPDDLPDHSLWALRDELRTVEVGDEDAAAVSWADVDQLLRDRFGYDPPAGSDPLRSLGEHFFPGVLAAEEGVPVPPANRRWTEVLAGQRPAMWNTPPGPFRYDAVAGELFAELPLRDADVLAKLQRIRQLDAAEQAAVQELYFAPQAELAPFAFLFENLRDATVHLVEQPDETLRWAWFQRAVTLAQRRAAVIAEHLAAHVGGADPELAWRLLRHLHGDENVATAPWEDDAAPPARTWTRPTGGAFAALLGLLGTGLLTEITPSGSPLVWRELSGDLAGFGAARDAGNSPVPTVVPAMALTLRQEQQEFALPRNGFAESTEDGTDLGGFQGYRARFAGVLLVEQAGDYEFRAGAPNPDGPPDQAAAAADRRWQVTLRRGQRTWVILSHDWPDEQATGEQAGPMPLQRGAYQLLVELEQPAPAFTDADDVCPVRGGLQLSYRGPDTGDALVAVPRSHLFRARKDGRLDAGLPATGATASRLLADHFPATLRDVRRTYQRAFLALLLAHRFGLAADPVADDGTSEIEYLLANPDRFAGQAYYRQGGGLVTHRAHFDPDLLPVRDGFDPPSEDGQAAVVDARSAPSAQRRAALFDWWERLFDYTAVRRAVATAPEPPLWLLFHESAEGHPDIPAHLHRHLGVDLLHVSLLTTLDGQPIVEDDLADDRWPVRLWHAERWLDAVRGAFLVRDIRDARPSLWAAPDPGAGGGASGNARLTLFVRDGCIENGEPRRYADIAALNDGLRHRGRAALLAYLASRFGVDPAMLSAALLIDVEAGPCQRMSRVEDAVAAVQAFVQRARLGLEPTLPVTAAFALLWERRFAEFRTWERCARRALYPEDVVEWSELERARHGEAFQFLEAELRRRTLTLAQPGGLVSWPGDQPPSSGLTLLQSREPARLRRVDPAGHGFDLLGTPERHARPSWLAVTGPARPEIPDDGGNGNGGNGGEEPVPVPLLLADAVADAGAELRDQDPANLPWWIRAAIRLGTRFVRVAAAAVQPASARFHPYDSEASGCCTDCGSVLPLNVDEYYFWLLDAGLYQAVTQEADDGAGVVEPGGVIEGGAALAEPWSWHDLERLPTLLSWNSDPAVHLAWCRVHNGELTQLRRSTEALQVEPGVEPSLVFAGRTGDSLRFVVPSGLDRTGYADEPEAGFRYDLVPDTAAVLPELTAPPPAQSDNPGGLSGFPHFAFHTPGAPVRPSSPFAPAVTVAAALRAHCRFDDALAWYSLAFDPLGSDNSWCSADGDDTRPVDPAEVARHRAVQLQYLRTLLDWADALLRRRSPEAVGQARVVVETAMQILGPAPIVVSGSERPVGTVAAFSPSGARLNPSLRTLYEQAADRLALIHHCLNGYRLRGDHRPYWGEPERGRPQPCLDELDWCVPQSCYRFTFLVQKAQELAGQVRDLGAALLAAYEKGDAEFLASLRATHERQLVNLALEIRQQQWREADWQVQALEKAKEIAQTRLRYTAALIQEGLISEEDQYVFLTYAALGLRTAAGISEGIAQALGATPDIFTGVAGFGGTPLFYQQIPIGTKLAGVLATAARISTQLAEISGTTAGLRLTEGGFARREDEWRHQLEVLGLEIQQIERQLLAAERRRDIALRELNNHQRQVEHAAEVHDFLRDKFTAHQLYLFLQQETAALHAESYQLAVQVARQAERAFNLELGHTTRTFVGGEIWDDLREGLLAGERLTHALKRMEQAYLDANCREYELTKYLSLRQHFPAQFLALQTTGRCEIDIEEWRFDHDHPGHYLRRIKNVDLTVSCVAGPYTGVHCTLTLLRSSTRIDPALTAPVRGCCPDDGDRTGYQPAPEDPRFVVRHGATQALATSRGLEDGGVFELSFRDERYLRFEFEGAVSRWRIELPPENNRFDLADVADVVLRMNYTAREGGDVVRRAATTLARRHLPDSGVRYFDVRHDLPDSWSLFEARDGCGPRELRLRLHRAMFPFVPGSPPLTVNRFAVLFEGPGAVPNAHHIVTFQPSPPDGGRCRPDRISCVVGTDLPNLFHGVVDLPAAVTVEADPQDLGVMTLPTEIGPVRRAHLLCWYRIVDKTTSKN